MKLKDIVALVRAHYDQDETTFRLITSQLANEMMETGKMEISRYLMSLMSDVNTVQPQSVTFNDKFLNEVEIDNDSLPLPPVIMNDLKGIVYAINSGNGLSRFLFEGEPGTGKTESAKQIARLTRRTLLQVDFNQVIDSRLGQTSKNIAQVFDEIKQMPNPARVIILFDEIDALALDRTDSHDVREMGRATSSILQQLDQVGKDVVIIATTNLFKRFDPAFKRRFHAVISFDRYTESDLVAIGVSMVEGDLPNYPNAKSDVKLLKKILKTAPSLPMPGELKNLAKVSLAFSNPLAQYDYLIRLYCDLNHTSEISLAKLREQGFTIREAAILTGSSKSTIGRELKEKRK